MTRSLRQLSYAMLVAFAVVALTLGYWMVVRSDQLLARDDNPRRILAEQRAVRGEVLDRSGRPLAQTMVDPESGLVERSYPAPAAAPVVGYYSVRFGVSGIEAAHDDLLRGASLLTPGEALQRDLLHQATVGGDVRLTLDVELQRSVAELLEGHKGAAVVLSVPSGEVLAMASAPTFDPNTIDGDWEELRDDPEAPLLNRATQGQYQPGEILQSVILGIGLNRGVASTEDEWNGPGAVEVDGVLLPCAGGRQGVTTLGEAYVSACPAPFRLLAERIGQEALLAGLADFGLLSPPTFALPTAGADAAAAVAQQNPSALGTGQGSLTVSPLQMALVAAAYADNGRIPPLHIVAAERAPGGQWQPVDPDSSPRGTISPGHVDLLSELMQAAADEGAAAAAGGGQGRVYGHAGLAVAGPEGTYNAWFIGFMRQGEGRAVATAVLVEDVASVDLAARIGGEALRSAAAVAR